MNGKAVKMLRKLHKGDKKSKRDFNRLNRHEKASFRKQFKADLVRM